MLSTHKLKVFLENLLKYVKMVGNEQKNFYNGI